MVDTQVCDGNHLIPRAYAQCHQGDVHASGGRVERNGMLAAVCVTELLFQFVTLRARGDPSRFQHLTDSAYFGVADGWLRKWQKVLHRDSTMNINQCPSEQAALNINFNIAYIKLAPQWLSNSW